METDFNQFWVAKRDELIQAVNDAFLFKPEEQTFETMKQTYALETLERMAWQRQSNQAAHLDGLKNYLLSLPRYSMSKAGNQERVTKEHHQYLAMTALRHINTTEVKGDLRASTPDCSEDHVKVVPSSQEMDELIDAAMGLVSITVRLDKGVFESLREEASNRNIGIRTLLNTLISEHAKNYASSV